MGGRVAFVLAVLAIVSAGGGLVFLAVSADSAARRQQALELAMARVQRGDFKQALPELERQAADNSSSDEIQLALGICYRGLDRTDDAIAAWNRIQAGKAVARQAASWRLQTARDTGRWSLARGLKAADLEGDQATEDLLFLLRSQGRIPEAVELVRDTFGRAGDPARALKLLWALEMDAYPVAGVNEVLERARTRAPDDPDVTLGRAHLALQSGALEEARLLLDRCHELRPDDGPTWVMEVLLARAGNDSEALERALRHLPPEAFDAEGWLALQAQLVRGRTGREAAILQRLLAVNPYHAEALERMAELSTPPSDAPYRARKAARDAAQRRYEGLLTTDDGGANLIELAETAAALGRTFDARGWLTMAARQTPGDAAVNAKLRALEPDRRAMSVDLARLRDEALNARGTDQGLQKPLEMALRPPQTPRFIDVSDASGLVFRFDNGRTAEKQLPETMSGGVALFDFDNDGWLDLYAVQGGRFPALEGAPNADRLFRNRGDGTFEDVSATIGLDTFPGGYGHGVTIGDVDNDGFSDIFVTRFGSYALYLNQQGTRFRDATNAWGLGGDRDWPTSAAFADLDGDGDLDLYVCHYAEWDPQNPRVCRLPDGERITYCPPAALAARPDRLYRNDGDQFVDISKEAGISSADRDGRGLGVVAADLDGDQKVDLFVANDTTANYFFKNLGEMRFQENALAVGLSANASGGYLAGMGAARGDLDGDGVADLGVTNFYGECTTFYRALGGGIYADRSAEIGLASATRDRLGFGLTFADMNNDGNLDVVQANGHVDDFAPAYPYAMSAQLLLGRDGGGLFGPRPQPDPWSRKMVARGLAVGDLNNDGALDAVVVDQAGPMAVFQGARPVERGHFLTLKLRGHPSNRDAVGAVATVRAGDRTWVLERFGGGSYQSSGDSRLHVGLGERGRVDLVAIRWPSGAVRQYHDLAADRGYLLSEDGATPEALPGFK